MITIDPDLLDDLFYVAQAASPQECCGLLLAECGDEHRIIECELLRNEAQDAVSTIYVSASRIADVAAVLEGRYAIVGTFHSHPHGPAIASGADLKYVALVRLPSLIVSPYAHEARLYEWAAPLVVETAKFSLPVPE